MTLMTEHVKILSQTTTVPNGSFRTTVRRRQI